MRVRVRVRVRVLLCACACVRVCVCVCVFREFIKTAIMPSLRVCLLAFRSPVLAALQTMGRTRVTVAVTAAASKFKDACMCVRVCVYVCVLTRAPKLVSPLGA